jgi:hypothetical protein
MNDMTEQTTQVKVDPGIFVTINLPDTDQGDPKLISPIVLQHGDTVQWRYGEQFSVTITPGFFFDQSSLFSQKQSDGSFLTGTATVIGPNGTRGMCTYALGSGVLESGRSRSAANTPPPPNDIIVDSSTPSLERLRLELIKRVTVIETDDVKRKRLIDAINDVLKISSGNSQPETENRNGRTPK